MEDVVYLQNGSIIHGLIIEQVPNVSIKIQTRDGNVFVYKMEEIEKITKEVPKNYTFNNSFNEKRGFFNLFRVGIMTASSVVDNTVFALGSISGSRLSDAFRLGFGVEYNNYPNGTTVPLFLDLRVNTSNEGVVPIFFLDAGYSLAWINGLSGMNGDGLFLNVGLGTEFPLSNSGSLFLELSYKRQDSELVVSNYYFNGSYINSYTSNVKITYDFLALMFGYSF